MHNNNYKITTTKAISSGSNIKDHAAATGHKFTNIVSPEVADEEFLLLRSQQGNTQRWQSATLILPRDIRLS